MRMMVRDMKGCRIIEWVHWIRGIIVSRMVWRNRFWMMICRGVTKHLYIYSFDLLSF